MTDHAQTPSQDQASEAERIELGGGWYFESDGNIKPRMVLRGPDSYGWIFSFEQARAIAAVRSPKPPARSSEVSVAIPERVYTPEELDQETASFVSAIADNLELELDYKSASSAAEPEQSQWWDRVDSLARKIEEIANEWKGINLEFYTIRAMSLELSRELISAFETRPVVPEAPHPAPEADMAYFGASDGACYLYPEADQQALRDAFCRGAGHAVGRSSAVPETTDGITRAAEMPDHLRVAARQAIDRWIAIEGAAEHLVLAVNNAAADPRKSVRERLVEVADEVNAALGAPEPPTEWIRNIAALAADRGEA